MFTNYKKIECLAVSKRNSPGCELRSEDGENKQLYTLLVCRNWWHRREKRGDREKYLKASKNRISQVQKESRGIWQECLHFWTDLILVMIGYGKRSHVITRALNGSYISELPDVLSPNICLKKISAYMAWWRHEKQRGTACNLYNNLCVWMAENTKRNDKRSEVTYLIIHSLN